MELQAKEFIRIFTGILYQALPFIVLGAVIAGMLEELVPQRFISRIIPRNRFLAIAIGGFLGLIFPMCECGIVPVMRRLLRKGLPLSTCICYMLSGPIINVIVLMSTSAAFSGMEAIPSKADRAETASAETTSRPPSSRTLIEGTCSGPGADHSSTTPLSPPSGSMASSPSPWKTPPGTGVPGR